MSAALLSKLTQVVMDFAVTIDATALQPGVLDQTQQPLIILSSCRLRLSQPGVVTAGMYFKGQAQTANRIVC